jgi:hypothetical protein
VGRPIHRRASWPRGRRRNHREIIAAARGCGAVGVTVQYHDCAWRALLPALSRQVGLVARDLKRGCGAFRWFDRLSRASTGSKQ